ncbi:hypothetical protein GKZ28_01665 [Clostridium chromiireducens]|uniref:Uncharacterized protein n=1 Tax=Clostridium chromiireducens TaxID=225345 RepID=A0A964W0W5_9CLOT|nr:hypothetical protein [Clostridium chromiireducens]MVX62408.1 hypothetical protein [Clostridium chromiireducens]
MGTNKGNLILQSIPERKFIIDNYDIYRFKYKGQEIMISDDIWQFKEIKTDSGACFKSDFSEFGEKTKKISKIIMMDIILSNLGRGSIDKYIINYRNISKFLEGRNIVSCDLITKLDIDAYIEYLNLEIKTENERVRRKRCLKSLLVYISAIYNVDYSNYYGVLEESDTKLMKCQIKENKKPKVPQEVFLRTIELSMKNLEDNTLTIQEKILSALVLFITQTGMRQKDIIYLEKDRKKFKVIKGINERVAYLHHRTFKSEKGKMANNEGRWVYTYLSERAEKAYDTLIELLSTRESQYIFSNDQGGVKITATIERWIKKFYIRFADELGVYNREFDDLEKKSLDELVCSKFASKEVLIKNGWGSHSSSDFISIPTICQFRVSVCNELFDQGINIYWIMKHMQHLTEEMTLYYAREKDEEREFAKRVVKAILKDEYTLLGENGAELTKKIKEFLENGDIEVEKNLDSIIEKIVDEVPIREKKYGFCIKSSFGKKCKYNEFSCAFEECPNYFTSFLFVDISYERYKDFIKIIEYNLENEFNNQGELEKDKMIKFIRKTLLPELKQLKEKIDGNGFEYMLSEYKELEYLILNIDSIIMEVKKWL